MPELCTFYFYIFRVYCWNISITPLFKRCISQECTHFPKIWEPPPNSMSQKGDKKQDPYRGPTTMKLCVTLTVIWRVVLGARALIHIFVNVKLTLDQAQKGSRGTAVLFLYPWHQLWCGRPTPRQGRFTRGKLSHYPSYMRMGGSHGWSERVRKISPPTWNRSLDRPSRSVSLYLLSYSCISTFLYARKVQ